MQCWGLTKVTALEYARENIRIMSISPGGVDTPMLRAVRDMRGITLEQGSAAIPIGRTNTVEERARTVPFLASGDATAFHGSLVATQAGFSTEVLLQMRTWAQSFRRTSVSPSELVSPEPATHG